MEKDTVRRTDSFPAGYTALSEIGGRNADMLMDLGVLRLAAGEEFSDGSDLEKAILLVSGEVEFVFEGRTERVRRSDCFNGLPFVLHQCRARGCKIRGVAPMSELTVSRAENEREFATVLYRPGMYGDEYRGRGMMGETSTRIVREVFGYRTAPYSNLVVGEVIGFPGKWSSYPPHHHRQPEIYYYKTLPENGFAFADLGDAVLRVGNNDAVFIREGQIHPHVTAPGYALWYLWVIRHLPGDPYVAPTFVPEHEWVARPECQGRIWRGADGR